MMNVRKLFFPIRAFSTKRDKKFSNKNVKNVQSYQFIKSNHASPNPGIGNRLKMYEKDETAAEISASHEFEDLHEDMDEFETDFMNAGKSHRMHEKEVEVRNEKLKTKITFSKYLKEVEPSFLTFAEKEEIKSLHEREPHEWSVEKLSQSFPASPATIKKVLHAKWSPKSVETVVKYDERVIKNWEAFRAGELPLSPMMEKHLQNFKDRRIVQTNRELAKRFVPPKMEFPKPKSSTFSRIAQTLIQNKENKISTSDTNTEQININIKNKLKKRGFEANKDFHVSSNVEGKNKDRDFQENEDFDEEIFGPESKINFQEQKIRFVSNRNWDIKNMNSEIIRNLDLKNISLETKGNFSYKKRNFEESENTKKVGSLTIQEGHQNTEVVFPPRAENKMTMLSQNLKENDPQEIKKHLTFEEFLIKNVGRTKDSSTPENIVLKETYKRHLERIEFDSKPARPRESETEEEDFNSESKFEFKESTIESNISSLSLKEEGKVAESRILTRRLTENEISNFNKLQTDLISEQKESELSFGVERNTADTYLKEWIKKGDDIDDDPPFIKIPKHRYKEGMTYRVKNCYYDDDGEFLYKVPGLHN